jgi:hypothetical protein
MPWEYLEARVNYFGQWSDNHGSSGELPSVTPSNSRLFKVNPSWAPMTPLLNQWGRDGWELVNFISDSGFYRLILKRPLGG